MLLQRQNFGAAWADISTGEVNCKRCTEFNELLEIYLSISPSELVVTSDTFLTKNSCKSYPAQFL